MLQRKRSFIIVALCGLGMSFTSEPSFVVGWLLLLGAIFSISTIAYDEHDNCFPFLMTLPVSRKCYAVEKYVFGCVCSVIFWAAGILIYAASSCIRGINVVLSEEIAAFIVILFVPLFILDISIPFNLKFGSEKGRIYMLVFWGAIFAASMILAKKVSFNSSVSSFSQNVSDYAVLGITAAVVLVLTAASVAWSIRIMDKKEF